MKITLLRPTWAEACTSKAYSLENGKVITTQSYKLGKFFNWSSIYADGLKGFYDLLVRCQNARVFRMAGTPISGLGQNIQRLKDNFVDDGTTLLHFDMDDWPLEKGYDLKTKDNIHIAVKHLLCDNLGFDFLRDCACVVLLSNSAWSYYLVRAHVYFELSSSIKLEFLHKWGLSFNSLDPKYKIDYSLFQPVQPDYISKRICSFSDPLADSLRLTLHCDNLSPYVNKAVLVEQFIQDINTSEAYSQSSNYPVVKKQTSGIAATWEETLKLCGSAQYGINDPAYRACAQLVQHVGNQVIEANLNYYVEKVFNLVWSAINIHGIRNGKKERDYYDKPRFRNYLVTALQKNFGANTDSVSNSIGKAIKLVIDGGSPAILFDHDMLEKYRQLRSSDPGKWAMVRNIIKTKLKGRVTIGDIDKALSSSKAEISSQIDQVLKSFEWVEGTIDQGLYCKTKRKNGYSLVSIDAGVDSDVYAKALQLFSDGVPAQFEKNVLKVLLARSRDVAVSPFAKAVVETRCHTVLEGGKNVLYYNMGQDSLGDMETCVVKANSVEIVNSKDVPVIWITDRTIMQSRMSDPGKLPQSDYIKLYLKKFRKFVTAQDAEDLVDVMAWQISAIINTGVAPLLEISGASGDGKSTSALFIKELVDPTSSSIRDGQDLHNGFYKKEDMAKVLRSRHVTIFDNLSNLKPGTQDLLCSVATGWKYDLRIMYTQQFMPLIIKKPIVLTCLAPVITNQDLRSRSISVSVSRKRRSLSGDIYTLWEKEAEDMRTGLFHLVSKTIEYVDSLRLSQKDMNDRDLWLVAARTVIMRLINYKNGNTDEIRRAILGRKRDRDIQEALTTSTSAHLIAWIVADVELFTGRTIAKTPSELYILFKKFVNMNAGAQVLVQGIPVEITMHDIPQSTRSFGIMLSKHSNDILSATGWEIDNLRTGGARKRVFTFKGD